MVLDIDLKGTIIGSKLVVNDMISSGGGAVYNILGDYPDVVAKFLVEKMLKNNKNNVKIEWLTNKKATFRFITSMFNKRDFFK